MTSKQAAEATTTQGTTITYRDLKFAIEPFDDWAFSFIHHWEREQPTLALELMLGTEQYAAFVQSKPKITDMAALVNQVFSAFGQALGESAASPQS